MARKKNRGAGKGMHPIALLILGAALLLPVCGVGYLLYMSDYVPRSVAREFLGLLASERFAEAAARIEPDKRTSYPESKVREWGAGVRGYSDIDWGRKSSTGTTRGGRTISSTSGFLQYPNTKAERTFSISVIKDDGTWYVSSFSLGALAEPR